MIFVSLIFVSPYLLVTFTLTLQNYFRFYLDYVFVAFAFESVEQILFILFSLSLFLRVGIFLPKYSFLIYLIC